MGRNAPPVPLGGFRPSGVGAPGSNGFWRRRIYNKPGTYNWTAPKSGKVKAQMIGAAAGGSGSRGGASGGYGDKTFDVVEGQTITIVVGGGSAGVAGASLSANAGATSISGAPVTAATGGPLTIAGATGCASSQSASATYGTQGLPSGSFDKSFPGAVNQADSCGGTSSASPFGPGNRSQGQGGSGWGGGALSQSGAGTHGFAAESPSRIGGPGLTAESADFNSPNGKSRPFWDLEDADSSGGTGGVDGAGNPVSGGQGGVGSGAGWASANLHGVSPLGGGTSSPCSQPRVKSGNGAGGGCSNSATGTGGDGGDGWVAIFWDEVA